MEIITTIIITVAVIVWFFNEHKRLKAAADLQKHLDALDKKSEASDEAYFAALKERAYAGDESAKGQLVAFGYDRKAWGNWERKGGR